MPRTMSKLTILQYDIQTCLKTWTAFITLNQQTVILEVRFILLCKRTVEYCINFKTAN